MEIKKILYKFLSIALSTVLILNSTIVPTFAMNYNKNPIGAKRLNHIEIDNETVREIYNNLTPEAKEIFDTELSRDPQLLSFHIKNVDSSFSPTLQKHLSASYSFRSVGALKDPMVTLSNQIAVLGLPSAVVYSLKAMGASMIAAISDGPLPFGDILLAASAASVTVTMGLNWDVVEPKFDRIVQAFKTAFSSVGSNISSAFSKIKNDAKKEDTKKKKKENPTGKKVRDVHKRLRKEGFAKVGQKGSHEQWKKGNRKVTVPNHGEGSDLDLQTLRSIWRQAGWI